MSQHRDLQAILRSYVLRMLREADPQPLKANGRGYENDGRGYSGARQQMKVLVLDDETVRFVATVLSQRDILDLGVYLTEKIESYGSLSGGYDMDASFAGSSGREQYLHMKAVFFVRPTKGNIASIRQELKRPRFGSYFINFGASSEMIDRVTEGIASAMLSLRHRFQIRYQRGSELTLRVAQSLHQLTYVDQRELYDFGSRDGSSQQHPILLLLDRREDPVTPLLSQWTYQAMIHELLGMADNIVALESSTPRHSSAKKQTEYVLSSAQDDFFRRNRYSNFGDVGMAVKTLVDQMSSDHRHAKDFDSIDDIAQFVEHLPERTQQQGVTSKHVSIMSALSHEVEERSLMLVSGIEQDICCQSSSISGHYDSVASIIRNPQVRNADKARLVLLYCLRYESEAPQQTSSLFGALEKCNINASLLSSIRYLRKKWSQQQHVLDLFSDKTLSSRFASLAKQHLRGVENVYTQHTPALLSILEKAARGRLPATDYPCIGSDASTFSKGSKLIIAFIIGGATYEEAKVVAELNSNPSDAAVAGCHVLLGSTGSLNSTTFLSDLKYVAELEKYQNQYQNLRR
eukprot:jgi/Picsp_1/6262/NSC_03615-R2_vacuolar protein sorting homolog